MAFKFNPFTGTLDQTGSGGGASYIDGEVQNFSALPETIGTPAVDSAYLVREAEGTWLLARKPAGIYIRTADTGVRTADWTHASAFPDVFSDAAFTVYSDGDSTKNLQLSLSGLTTGTTRTLTAPDASGTIALLDLKGAPCEFIIACSDETTNLTTGTAKVTFRAPYAFLLTGVRASVNTAPTGSTLIVDINNGANSALSTKLSIDASEKTSTTAATAAVIDTTYDDIADDAELTIDIDQIGSTIAGKGLKVTLIGTRA
jgi:hypothetical protein